MTEIKVLEYVLKNAGILNLNLKKLNIWGANYQKNKTYYNYIMCETQKAFKITSYQISLHDDKKIALRDSIEGVWIPKSILSEFIIHDIKIEATPSGLVGYNVALTDKLNK